MTDAPECAAYDDFLPGFSGWLQENIMLRVIAIFLPVYFSVAACRQLLQTFPRTSAVC
jgi:hypothetical protein